MSRTSTNVRNHMLIIGKTLTSLGDLDRYRFLGSSVIIRLLALVATQVGPSAVEDQVGCYRRKGKHLAARPLDFGDIHSEQRKLVTCERASEDLREVDHAGPFKWLGHRPAILLPRPN